MMRDKLVEIIAFCFDIDEGGYYCLNERQKDDIAEEIADRLIARGVKIQRKSQWSNVSGGRTICKHCGEYPLYDYFGRQKFSNFCPNCGYDMSGET